MKEINFNKILFHFISISISICYLFLSSIVVLSLDLSAFVHLVIHLFSTMNTSEASSHAYYYYY